MDTPAAPGDLRRDGPPTPPQYRLSLAAPVHPGHNRPAEVVSSHFCPPWLPPLLVVVPAKAARPLYPSEGVPQVPVATPATADRLNISFPSLPAVDVPLAHGGPRNTRTPRPPQCQCAPRAPGHTCHNRLAQEFMYHLCWLWLPSFLVAVPATPNHPLIPRVRVTSLLLATPAINCRLMCFMTASAGHGCPCCSWWSPRVRAAHSTPPSVCRSRPRSRTPCQAGCGVSQRPTFIAVGSGRRRWPLTPLACFCRKAVPHRAVLATIRCQQTSLGPASTGAASCPRRFYPPLPLAVLFAPAGCSRRLWLM